MTHIEQLMEKVRARLDAEGKGSARTLADRLGVSAQQLNHWLNLGREPGGNYALLLREWVESKPLKPK